MKNFLAAVVLLTGLAAVAAAETPATPAAAPAAAVDVKSEHSRIAADEAAIKKDWTELKSQFKSLDADADKEIAKIRADLKSKKDAARTQTKADVKSKRDDIASARKNLRQAHADKLAARKAAKKAAKDVKKS
jgi:hypothetical protein